MRFHGVRPFPSNSDPTKKDRTRMTLMTFQNLQPLSERRCNVLVPLFAQGRHRWQQQLISTCLRLTTQQASCFKFKFLSLKCDRLRQTQALPFCLLPKAGKILHALPSCLLPKAGKILHGFFGNEALWEC